MCLFRSSRGQFWGFWHSCEGYGHVRNTSSPIMSLQPLVENFIFTQNSPGIQPFSCKPPIFSTTTHPPTSKTMSPTPPPLYLFGCTKYPPSPSLPPTHPPTTPPPLTKNPTQTLHPPALAHNRRSNPWRRIPLLPHPPPRQSRPLHRNPRYQNFRKCRVCESILPACFHSFRLRCQSLGWRKKDPDPDPDPDVRRGERGGKVCTGKCRRGSPGTRG